MNPLTSILYLRPAFACPTASFSRQANNDLQIMKFKSFLAKPFASYIYSRIRKGMSTAVADQEEILKNLVKTGKITEFGQEHKLGDVDNYQAYRQAVPIRDYEGFRGYIDKIKEGKSLMFWGIIALTVMVSVWGIVAIVYKDFFGGNLAFPLLRTS